ncbi:PREDICTED: uncharacterized protein LOC100634800 [Amphimedon queenslandica]|uniref:cardiolipin synthase (CMP-forming) n=1 Tax=Amphimedon queenslandica TaxID=400682 RepID=A0AAN0K4K7_AMPQE|nr:PREDICTED: uncharacterized protein LOC100634800 [Amphimedon queenslandica]|eukprot:XP_019864251.1 PREDICTED: uncharacterized protein LOC100634800 [Amphimedon queenslandica]
MKIFVSLLFCIASALAFKGKYTEWPVSLDMSCEPSSSDVDCTFDFVNVAGEDYYLLMRNTPLEGLLSPFIAVYHKGRRLEYEGKLIHRRPPTKDEYILLKAGEKVSATVHINDVFTLIHDGGYTIEYIKPLMVLQEEIKMPTEVKINSATYIYLDNARKVSLPRKEVGLRSKGSVTIESCTTANGFIARRFPSQSSKLGSILDPLADKCLISVLYISLTIVNLIPLPLTFLIISRDLMLVGGSFYLRYVTLPPPRTWRRYWDVERSGLQITPNLLGKANTALQLMLVGITMLSPLLDCIDQQLLKLLWFTVGTTTIASGMSYCVQLKGFQIIKKRHLK